MIRRLYFVYGVFSHLLFLLVYAYLAGFVGDRLVPVSIDAAGAGFSPAALAVDAALVLLFGLQHSIMARPAFKAWWTRFVPTEIERSTYVLISNAVVALLIVFWQPLGPTVWDVQNGVGRAALWALFAAGWVMVPAVSLLIDHFDLFGTRQVWLQLRGRPYSHRPFRTPGVYRYVRHPLYVGWLVAFWATPTMSAGHLLFAGLMTLYIAIAIPHEEHDLEGVFGARYRAYRSQVPALVPSIARRSRRHTEASTC